MRFSLLWAGQSRQLLQDKIGALCAHTTKTWQTALRAYTLRRAGLTRSKGRYPDHTFTVPDETIHDQHNSPISGFFAYSKGADQASTSSSSSCPPTVESAQKITETLSAVKVDSTVSSTSGGVDKIVGTRAPPWTMGFLRSKKPRYHSGWDRQPTDEEEPGTFSSMLTVIAKTFSRVCYGTQFRRQRADFRGIACAILLVFYILG